MTKLCPKCGNEVEAEDLDRPAYFYYCDTPGCGWELCDTLGWADRMADRADSLRKAQKEQGI